MGWAAGSGLGEEIWEKVREYVPEDKREEVAKFIYDSVCDLDADDWDGQSQLEADAGVTYSCWNCDEEVKAGSEKCNGCGEEQ